MQIRLTANVGIFNLEALVTGTDEAMQFANFVYTLGDQEERAAIQTEYASEEKAAKMTAEMRASRRAEAEVIETALERHAEKAATIEDAVKAVKEYAAVHKPDAARALMAKVGISRTSEITAEIAPKIVELIKGEA